MPKMKSCKSASKRFRVTSSGRVKRGQSHRRHILTSKSTKRKRHLRSPQGLNDSDAALVPRMLPYHF